MNKLCKKIIVAGVGVVILVFVVLALVPGNQETEKGWEIAHKTTHSDVELRISRTKAELDKIRMERGKDGKPGKLNPLDVTRPEVVLPPTLALLDEELKSCGIDREQLIADIKGDPDSFRVVVPEFKRKRFLILKPEHEKLIGGKQEKELSGKVYHNSADEARVHRVSERIWQQLPPDTPHRIFLYEDDTFNAFCIANGTVYVHSGLLKTVKSDDELALILGHEYAHAVARHVNEKITKLLFHFAGDIFMEFQQNKLKEKGKGKTAIFARIGYFVGGFLGFNLPYSRKMEHEADALGLRYMARAGYDPSIAVDFWSRLSQKSEDSFWKGFLSTHPTDRKRLARMKKELKNIQKGKTIVAQPEEQ